MTNDLTLDERLQALAAAENNVVSRPELHAIGLTDGMIRTQVARKRWRQVQAGVYLLAMAPPTWEQRCAAALKAAGEGSRLAAESGLASRDIDGAERNEVHIAVDRKRCPRLKEVFVHRSRHPDKPHSDGPMPTSSIERLLLDFAATGTVTRVERAVENALSRGLTSERRLWQLVARSPDRMPGVLRLTRILEARPDGKAARSVMEIEFFKLLGQHGVPLPIRNFDVRVGTKRYEIDGAYPATKGAIECDSRRFHATASQRRRDGERQSALEADGWTFLRVTWRDIFGRPKWVVAQVLALMSGAEIAA